MSKKTLEGKLIFEPIIPGVRSSHIAPVLYLVPDGELWGTEKVALVSLDDPPFRYSTFSAYDRKFVSVKGKGYFQNQFVVSSINEIEKLEAFKQ